jgi:hypothetical protein
MNIHVLTDGVVLLVMSSAVIYVGISACVSARRGSCRYPLILGALGISVSLCLLMTLLHYNICQSSIHRLRGLTNSVDPAEESLEFARYYGRNALYILIAAAGMIFGIISLVLRRLPA